jgi:hypothetical protein
VFSHKLSILDLAQIIKLDSINIEEHAYQIKPFLGGVHNAQGKVCVHCYFFPFLRSVHGAQEKSCALHHFTLSRQ